MTEVKYGALSTARPSAHAQVPADVSDGTVSDHFYGALSYI